MIKVQSLATVQTVAPDRSAPDGFELVSAVYRRAIRDALGNDPIERVDAVHFLDIAAPDWREQLHERGRLS